MTSHLSHIPQFTQCIRNIVSVIIIESAMLVTIGIFIILNSLFFLLLICTCLAALALYQCIHFNKNLKNNTCKKKMSKKFSIIEKVKRTYILFKINLLRKVRFMLYDLSFKIGAKYRDLSFKHNGGGYYDV